MRMTRYGSGGPPLVLVHRLACDGSDWAAQVAASETRTIVVVGELPLFGLGHFPQIERSDEVNALIAGFARL
jgi:pimeloyl-ACP methyl ester carboxylesterase